MSSLTTPRGLTTPADGTASRRGVPSWVAALMVVVAAVLGGIVGRSTAPEPKPVANLAPPAVRNMIERQVQAVNSGDASRIAPFFAENGALIDIGNIYAAPVRGRDNVAKVLAADVALFGPFLERPVTILQRGQVVAYVSSWGDVKGGVVVFELDSAGKILNQWAMHSAQ